MSGHPFFHAAVPKQQVRLRGLSLKPGQGTASDEITAKELTIFFLFWFSSSFFFVCVPLPVLLLVVVVVVVAVVVVLADVSLVINHAAEVACSTASPVTATTPRQKVSC